MEFKLHSVGIHLKIEFPWTLRFKFNDFVDEPFVVFFLSISGILFLRKNLQKINACRYRKETNSHIEVERCRALYNKFRLKLVSTTGTFTKTTVQIGKLFWDSRYIYIYIYQGDPKQLNLNELDHN